MSIGVNLTKTGGADSETRGAKKRTGQLERRMRTRFSFKMREIMTYLC